jgi:hypothetical protein
MFDKFLKRLEAPNLRTMHVWLVPTAAVIALLACSIYARFGRFSEARTQEPPQRFFEVSAPDLWGDYGHILINGMTAHLEEKNGMLQLERAGPFIPPLSFPGLHDFIVSDEFRKKLENSGLGTFAFRPVVKARIVDLQWQDWDRKAEDAPVRPETGEPEDYILGRPHSEKLADAMGEVWQVILKDGATVDALTPQSLEDPELRVHSDSWKGEHLFSADHRWVIVTVRGKQWLEENAGEWVRFRPLPTR